MFLITLVSAAHACFLRAAKIFHAGKRAETALVPDERLSTTARLPLEKSARPTHNDSICHRQEKLMRRDSDSMKTRVESLSPRQRQIVRLTSLGCTSHEIAAILGMSRWTVENHQFQAKERLGVSKAAVLTRIAIKYKISSLDDQLSKTEQRKLDQASDKPSRKPPSKAVSKAKRGRVGAKRG
jgi:DNA-binding CsgD family transcriptional regulator